MVVLPDVLELGLKVVFCGTAVGKRSGELGQYYAGRGNRFWEILCDIGLTPRKLAPSEFRILPQYGIGLTDLVKNRAGNDNSLNPVDYDVCNFRSTIEKFAPAAIAFNGKSAAQVFLGYGVNYGRQCERIGQTAIFVLPSTSAAARRYWDTKFWEELADFVS